MSGCSTCPGAKVDDKVRSIKQALGHLVQGHQIVAMLYDEIAGKTSKEEDKIAFSAAANRHRRLAEESNQIVFPDDMAEEMNADQKGEG